MTVIYDSLFAGQQAVHASDGRFGAAPATVIWERVESVDRDRLEAASVIWATDGRIGEMVRATEGLPAKRVGWLLEPADMHPENYRDAMRHVGFLDMIFVNDVEFHREVPRRTLDYPMGGTRLHPSHWRMPEWGERPANCSLILSEKRTLPGHKLRHELAEALEGATPCATCGGCGISYEPGAVECPTCDGGRRITSSDAVTLYGPSYNVIGSKAHALLRHEATFAIEPVSAPGWFTEHLIDPMLAGVVPIWNGSLSTLHRWGFNPDGVIICVDLKHAIDIVNELPQCLAEVKRDAMRHNFVKAHEYTCAEDWLYRNYPECFDE